MDRVREGRVEKFRFFYFIPVTCNSFLYPLEV
jgi:hypothetical protein